MNPLMVAVTAAVTAVCDFVGSAVSLPFAELGRYRKNIGNTEARISMEMHVSNICTHPIVVAGFAETTMELLKAFP